MASGGYSLVVHGFLTEVASLVAEDGLSGTQASLVAAHGLNTRGSWDLEHRLRSCGKRTYLLCIMWDLP